MAEVHAFGRKSWRKGWVKFSRISTSPDDVLAQLEESLLHDQGRAEAHVKAESERLNNTAKQVLRPTVSSPAPERDNRAQRVLAYGDYEILLENVCLFDFL